VVRCQMAGWRAWTLSPARRAAAILSRGLLVRAQAGPWSAWRVPAGLRATCASSSGACGVARPRLLDVGCVARLFLGMMRKQRLRVWGGQFAPAAPSPGSTSRCRLGGRPAARPLARRSLAESPCRTCSNISPTRAPSWPPRTGCWPDGRLVVHVPMPLPWQFFRLLGALNGRGRARHLLISPRRRAKLLESCVRSGMRRSILRAKHRRCISLARLSTHARRVRRIPESGRRPLARDWRTGPGPAARSLHAAGGRLPRRSTVMLEARRP